MSTAPKPRVTLDSIKQNAPTSIWKGIVSAAIGAIAGGALHLIPGCPEWLCGTGGIAALFASWGSLANKA